MGTLMIVVNEPCVKINLKSLHALVDLLAEGDLIELLQDGLVEALADAVRLR